MKPYDLFYSIGHTNILKFDKRSCPWFNGHFYNKIHLYGHMHMSFEWNMVETVRKEMLGVYGKPCRMFNVGCMMPYMEYKPRTLSEILMNEHMEGK